MKGLVQGGEDVRPGVARGLARKGPFMIVASIWLHLARTGHDHGGGALAGEGLRVEGAARAGGAAVRTAGLQLIDGERERAGRAERLDDGQGHDGLPSPAAPVVDVEREPGRQVDQLGRDDRQVVPRPPAGQGQPDPGEHTGGLHAALGQDPLAGSLHVRSVRLVAGQAQRHVGLDRGGQVPGPAVEVGPGAVVPLLIPDPARRRRDRLVVVQAEELAQQQVLGVHGDVGLELALPPALRLLQAERVVTCSVQGVAGEIEDRGVSYHWRAVMNSAIAVSSAWTLPGRSMSARLALAAASSASASVSAHCLPPAATIRSAARIRSSSESGRGSVSRACRSAASGVPLVSAATTGSDFLRARRSARTGLPVTSGAPQMPSRSSVSWNASPTCAPNPARAIASVGGAPRCTAPMLQAHAISAAVLSPAMSRHSASVTLSRFSKARSEPCPPISRCTAADRHRAAHAPCGLLSSSSMSWASASSASPARMAAPTPNTVQAVGRCLRSVSLSMMSSCSREKLCTSSTATAAVTPRSGGAPAARADSRASAGRSALPLPLLIGLPAASAKPRWYAATARTSGVSRAIAASIAGPTRSRAKATPSGITAVTDVPPSLR